MHGGCWTHGEASKYIRVSRQKEGPHIPNHMQIPPEHAFAQGSIGHIWGVFEHMGASKHMGVSKHTGGI